jgi:uncharacterized protein (TIGR02246 family)
MSNDEQEIRQLIATWMAATKAGDVETVLSLMADDAVFLCRASRSCAKPTSLPRRALK